MVGFFALCTSALAQTNTIRYEQTSGKYWGYNTDEVHKIDFTEGKVRLIMNDGSVAVETTHDDMHSFTLNDVPFETESIAIGSAGATTFSSAKALDFRFVTDAFAYVALNEVEDGVMRFTKVDDTVEGKTGLYVVRQGGTSDVLVPVIDSGKAYNDNKLVAVVEATDVSPVDGLKYNYVLQNQQVGGLGFYHLATTRTVPSKKAYLQLDAIVEGKLELSLDEATTSIRLINDIRPDNADEVIYNLQGLRVGKNYKGVVIIGGKKHVNR